MAESDTLAQTSGTTTYPPLTTIFTPSPACSSWHCSGCVGTTFCFAEAFPHSDACYPKAVSSLREGKDGFMEQVFFTYSPGLYCPLGMTTEKSVPGFDGVFCCPSGMTLHNDPSGNICTRIETGGTFALFSVCGDATVFEHTGSHTTTISISATPVFLGGQKILSRPSSLPGSLSENNTGPTTSSLTMPTAPGSGDDNAARVTRLTVAVAAGISGGVLLLLGLWAFWCVRRHRKKKAKQTQQDEQGATPATVVSGKAELVGSTFSGPFLKAELDPVATRAELEAPYEENGAGIFVHKPELHGSNVLGKCGDLRVFVKRKAELEAFAAGSGGTHACDGRL